MCQPRGRPSHPSLCTWLGWSSANRARDAPVAGRNGFGTKIEGSSSSATKRAPDLGFFLKQGSWAVPRFYRTADGRGRTVREEASPSLPTTH